MKIDCNRGVAFLRHVQACLFQFQTISRISRNSDNQVENMEKFWEWRLEWEYSILDKVLLLCSPFVKIPTFSQCTQVWCVSLLISDLFSIHHFLKILYFKKIEFVMLRHLSKWAERASGRVRFCWQVYLCQHFQMSWLW